MAALRPCPVGVHLPGETLFAYDHARCVFVPPRGARAGQRAQPRRRRKGGRS